MKGELDQSLEESELHHLLVSEVTLNHLSLVQQIRSRLLTLSWGEMGFIPDFSYKCIFLLRSLPIIDSNIQRNVAL